MLISIVIITYKRHDEVMEALQSIIADPEYAEIIIIDNDPQSNLENRLPKQSSIRYFLQKENTGVAGGRNQGIAAAKGDIMVFLDDDAVFESNHVLKTVREYFEQDKLLACLAFRIENYRSRKIVPMEFPHPDPSKADRELYVSYFLGGACALRRAAIVQVGPFLDLTYGGEELELSFRIIQAGYRLLYTPKILVLHKASAAGRFHDGRYIYLSIRNRLQILSAHLPFKYLIVNLSLWSLIWLMRAVKIGAVSDFIHGFRSGVSKAIANFRDSRRRPLSDEAISYLKKNGGRLWF